MTAHERKPTSRSGNALTFDAYNQLTAYGSLLTAGYNGDGLRAWKTTSAGSTSFLYDGSLPVLEMKWGGTVLAANTFGPNGLLSRRSGGASTFYQFDPQGSVAQRLNSAGAVLSSDMSESCYGPGHPGGPWLWANFIGAGKGVIAGVAHAPFGAPLTNENGRSLQARQRPIFTAVRATGPGCLLGGLGGEREPRAACPAMRSGGSHSGMPAITWVGFADRIKLNALHSGLVEHETALPRAPS